jgi:hypothetical protein
MGRPLKIKKSTTSDIGFNALSSLTNPIYPSDPTTFDGTEYLGVVGGANANVASAAYPVVKCRAFITGTLAEDDAYIITQKGSTKYQVATASAVNDEDMVVGQAYRILTVGTTNWAAVGGSSSAAIGDVFTATAAGAGTGTVQAVGTCILANEADTALTEGNMNITFSTGDSTAQLISRLTNRFALDYSTPAVRYAVNFFSDEGYEVKSGTTGAVNASGQQNRVSLAIVENYTS